MPSVWATVLFVYVSVNAVALGNPTSLSKWEADVNTIVQELNADIEPEPEHHIVSLQDHYNQAHLDLQARIEEDRKGDMMMRSMQLPVTGRYVVLLNKGVSDWHLDETIRILEEANYNSNGRLVAKHFKPLRILMKGFTATIGKKMLSIVSSVVFLIIIHLLYSVECKH